MRLLKTMGKKEVRPGRRLRLSQGGLTALADNGADGPHRARVWKWTLLIPRDATKESDATTTFTATLACRTCPQ
ncbi:hypothetical protein [Streptomyces hokutonensis]|uniref:hypothetical protein n=1 Tax=Streptomyces hokutonensis TaxID=1306990 RepID=UPI00369BC671